MKPDKNNTKVFITLFIIIIIMIIVGLYHYGSFEHPMKRLFDHKPEQAETIIPPDKNE